MGLRSQLVLALQLTNWLWTNYPYSWNLSFFPSKMGIAKAWTSWAIMRGKGEPAVLSTQLLDALTVQSMRRTRLRRGPREKPPGAPLA